MKLEDLFEARRNPDKNTKSYFVNSIQKYKDLPDDQLDKLYISMTDLNKLGINPKSPFSTPIGIYAYQLKYVLSHDRPDDLPFAGERTNAWIITPKTDVLVLNDYSNLDSDIEKIIQFIKRKWSAPDNNIIEIINDSKQIAKRVSNMQASVMWYACFALSEFLAKYDFKISFSDGYMLFVLDKNLKPPYFRRGLIRANKQ